MVISQSVSRYVNVTTGLAAFKAAANKLKRSQMPPQSV
ncbi:TPA: hypothetical protein MFE09_000037 [Klebsiella pneumoniae]|nr:hypothetical protein HMPREF3140_21205 [Klebsiella sp. HMSC16A12]HBT0110876.1 hypothetical protein [Klebsiella pneumoniae]HBT3448966.1 hypothetical protein [Klebsiella pneumoniae]HBT3466319.1 hypothetical protein [Klebsiella pneumoniae]HBW1526174.1 hypothetical protein [Klebsiella pneumoniae]